MELKLDKYTTESILGSYEFIFAQYLGGQTSSPEELESVPTVYIFGEMLGELRNEYLKRKDSSVEEMTKVEKSVINRVTMLMNIPESVLRKVYEDMLIKAEQDLKNIRLRKLKE